ncbi:AraC family transcriptional regulator [Chryseobacterium indologenes]|uniref:helix-turn-helix domain-containing protein n=1 Tax=Chryseobacterium indologenes TaxID=253 RepID=UPI000B516460|nr:helix-turn-helix domain-containing protein [Chryseobacterium indologenes]ASE60690.1 AraC family transcriptional regulator [Chryseobacterium indologenes]
MKIPYTLYSENEHINPDKQPHNLPERCRYFLTFAQEKQHFQIPEMELFSQQLNYKPFFVDLVEIEVKEPTYIPFLIHDRQLYMYFMLKGSLIYTTATKRPIIKTQANTFLMSYYDKGSYFAYAEQGEHIALVLSIHPDWIESIDQGYKNVQQILQRFADGKRPYETMSQCHMDRKIHRWLYKIYSYSQNNKGALDGNLRKYVSFLLEYYDSLLEDQNSDMAFKIKDFIEAHYCDVTLNIKLLSVHFFVTERTLLNIFKRRYHVSVQQFITGLRMSHALLLLDQKTIGIKDVYMEVGYADERSFRSALERYQNRKK